MSLVENSRIFVLLILSSSTEAMPRIRYHEGSGRETANTDWIIFWICLGIVFSIWFILMLYVFQDGCISKAAKPPLQELRIRKLGLHLPALQPGAQFPSYSGPSSPRTSQGPEILSPGSLSPGIQYHPGAPIRGAQSPGQCSGTLSPGTKYSGVPTRGVQSPGAQYYSRVPTPGAQYYSRTPSPLAQCQKTKYSGISSQSPEMQYQKVSTHTAHHLRKYIPEDHYQTHTFQSKEKDSLLRNQKSLENKIKSELETATNMIKTDRRKALMALKRKKHFEEQLKKINVGLNFQQEVASHSLSCKVDEKDEIEAEYLKLLSEIKARQEITPKVKTKIIDKSRLSYTESLPRLENAGFMLSVETPADGNCIPHALLDQMR